MSETWLKAGFEQDRSYGIAAKHLQKNNKITLNDISYRVSVSFSEL